MVVNISYKNFMHRLIESIFDDRIADKLQKELQDYIENKNNSKNLFVNFLHRITQIIRKYKLNSNITYLIPRIRDHLYHQKGLSESLRNCLKSGKEDYLKKAELYLAITMAHILSHNSSRSIKLPDKVKREACRELNTYLREIGIRKDVKLRKLERYEPDKLFQFIN